MKRLLLAAALLVSPGALAAPQVVVVEATGVDEARVRAEVGRELGAAAVAPSDPRAALATGRLVVEVQGKTLVVTFKKPSGAVRRTMPLPVDPESSAVILAGNLARDEAEDLLAGMARGAKSARRPRAPTPEQAAALAVMRAQADAYERSAAEYRDLITSIVKLHYEAKKKDVLAGLEREIAVENAALTKARETAIVRLEAFIAVHRGPEAADAMYRLAALYEERARAADGPLTDAIALYKRLLREHPTYREIGGVHYFLGHALNDAGRGAEAQAVWRSLVCHNHYAYDPDKLAPPLPQDAKDWTAWRLRYADPKSVSRTNPETVYVEVYPTDCAALPAQRYVAEVWWQIGNWEFDQEDVAAGPWAYARAASAYAHGLEPGPLYGVNLYKYAWTLYKQQRYEVAARAFVKLLRYTDEEEQKTSDPGADFRREAYTYIAGSLATLDFKGPAEWEPYVVRPDLLEAERDPATKLRVAIDRVKDPAIVPQDRPWTIEIYRALALELRAMNQHDLAIELKEAILRGWPMDPKAPSDQNGIAESFDEIALLSRPGSAEHDRATRQALDARTKLARYVGATPWVDANRDDPAAIHEAERLVRSGLRSAAAQHTNAARALVREGKTESLARAVDEYELAAIAWQSYLAQENAPDAYEASFWRAEAGHARVRLRVTLHELAPKTYVAPAADEIDAALAAARSVRDSNEDDAYFDVAAFFVVDLSDVRRDLAYARFRATNGAEGIERRGEVKLDASDRPIKAPIPVEVQASLDARDEYARLVTDERAADYAYYVAETYFLYGQWELARPRFEAMWRERCGVDAYGFKAWEKLLTMAAKQRDEARALALTAAVDPKKGGKSCNAEGEAPYTDRVRAEVAYKRARAKFEEACEAELGRACKDPRAPRKKPAWREAGVLFERALELSSSIDLATNAAYAYAQAGDTPKAAALYTRVVDAGGPNVAPAYEGLGAVYFALFDYPRAAETYAALAGLERAPEAARRDAAKNATFLYFGLNDRQKTIAAYRVLVRLHPTPADRALAEYRVASLDHAEARYYEAHRAIPEALPWVVEAAYAQAKPTKDRTWLARTIGAWDALWARDRSRAEAYAGDAAFASFALLDAEIADEFDAKQVYPTPVAAVLATFKKNADLAAKWDARLEDEVIQKYALREWAPVAYARRGAIFDTLRTGLYATTNVKLFDAREEALLARLLASNNPALIAKAYALKDQARELWLAKKKQELEAADEAMVRRYATAVVYARAYDVSHPAITRAIERLGYFTDTLGDDRMRALVTAVDDPTHKGAKLPYTAFMYVEMRQGKTIAPRILEIDHALRSE